MFPISRKTAQLVAAESACLYHAAPETFASLCVAIWAEFQIDGFVYADAACLLRPH